VLGLGSVEQIIAAILAALVGMTVHEFAHNYVGYKMGDPTPRDLGKLTLNPLVHINPLGFLMFVLIGFGTLGQAPISPYRMKADNRRWRWLAAVAAGPVSNLLLAIVFGILYQLLPDSVLRMGMLNTALVYMVYFNVLLFLFNLIPLFPLDGWQVVLSLLPPDAARWWQQNQQTSYYIFFGLILLSFIGGRVGIPNILGIIIGEPASAILSILLR
jgi:Zn-dependent protease